jgi:hypothetical protein
MPKLLLALSLLAVSPLAFAQPVPGFTYPDTDTARRFWQPQFGSQPVRVEKLPDGSACIALDAEFKAAGERVCWDWFAPLDLSQAGSIIFDASTTNAGLADLVGIYCGTPNGWYASIERGLPDAWGPVVRGLESFGTEGAPDGWGKVTVFRFSVWGAGPGKATFRLRRLRIVARDPHANYIRNGSFEAPGVGVPYAWGSGHWGIGNLPWAADMDLWRKHFHLDPTIAHDGKTSLCLDNTGDLPLLRAVSACITLPKTTVGTYILSAWLKSDQAALPVSVDCGGKGMTANVGAEWQQVALKGLPPQNDTAVAIAPTSKGKLWIDAVQIQPGDQPTAEFHPNDGDEALIAREKLVDWSPPRRTAEVAAGRSITGPLQAAKVSIDADGRFLLDGKPYIQHSLGLEFITDLGMIDVVAKLGFHDICIEINPSITTDKLRSYFDRCAQVGLRVIPWLDGAIPRERFIEHIKALKDHPALLTWYVIDEPNGEEGLKEANARYELAKELDPGHPALINYLSNKLEGHRGDIYSTDVYPIPHGAPTDAINSVARMKAAAEKQHKPVWMWLQGTGYAYWMDREPSPRELSCMVYGSLIAGARGIYWFAQIPRTKQCLDEMRAMCVEIDALTPALSSLQQAPPVTCDQQGIMCKAFVSEGKLWVLAVNTQSTAKSARLTVPGAKGQAEVVFEGRRVPVTNSVLQDRFGSYERHVYRVGAP